MLAALDYIEVTASNGLEALDLFYSGPELIDLVVTDLRMPVMDGPETVVRIRRLNPAVPIICMSTYSAQTCPAGVTFLAKPFTIAEVREALESALSSARVAR